MDHAGDHDVDHGMDHDNVHDVDHSMDHDDRDHDMDHDMNHDNVHDMDRIVPTLVSEGFNPVVATLGCCCDFAARRARRGDLVPTRGEVLDAIEEATTEESCVLRPPSEG